MKRNNFSLLPSCRSIVIPTMAVSYLSPIFINLVTGPPMSPYITVKNISTTGKKKQGFNINIIRVTKIIPIHQFIKLITKVVVWPLKFARPHICLYLNSPLCMAGLQNKAVSNLKSMQCRYCEYSTGCTIISLSLSFVTLPHPHTSASCPNLLK